MVKTNIGLAQPKRLESVKRRWKMMRWRRRRKWRREEEEKETWAEEENGEDEENKEEMKANKNNLDEVIVEVERETEEEKGKKRGFGGERGVR